MDQHLGLAFDCAVLTAEQLDAIRAIADIRSEPGSYKSVPTLADAQFSPDALPAVIPLVGRQ